MTIQELKELERLLGVFTGNVMGCHLEKCSDILYLVQREIKAEE
jgi:hypothetical protein